LAAGKRIAAPLRQSFNAWFGLASLIIASAASWQNNTS
jgi:hypothetical protein